MNNQPNFKTLILSDLKAQGLTDLAKKIKSIRYRSYSGGDSFDVQTENLFCSERKRLESILSEYQAGNFDGMIDLYENKKEQTKPRTAKFVHLHNEMTDDLRAYAKELLKNKWEVIDDDTAQDKFRCWYNQAVHRVLYELESNPLQGSITE